MRLPFRCGMFLLLLLFSSCSGSLLPSIFLGPALDNLQQQSDLELVCEGTPSYLLMVDSLIAADPGDRQLLMLGTKAYSGYIGAMAACGANEKRVLAMADKAYRYGTALLQPIIPMSPTTTVDQLEKALKNLSRNDIASLYWGTFGWLSWVEQQKGAPAAMADLVNIERILVRMIELDETYESGTTHLFLGAYYGSRPQMFGGRPEESKYHFERALQLSERKLLVVHTTYARTIARLTLDKKLHDNLLGEVLRFDVESSPENMLANQIAVRQARSLLQDEFFND